MGQKLNKSLTEKQNKAIEALENLPGQTDHRQTWFRYAVAASVLVIIGLSLYALKIPLDGTTKLYAMSDVPDLFNTARTLHIKGRIFFPEHPGTEPAVTEHWLDIEHGRWRSVTPSYTISNGNIDVYSTEEIYDGQDIKLLMDHRQKSCGYFALSPFQINLHMQRIQKTMLQMVCGMDDMLDTYQIQGQETIDGTTYNIWEGQVDMGPMQFKMRTWLSPYTGQMIKAVFWQSADRENWYKYCEFDMVELNAPIDESVFEFTIPGNYTAFNTLDTPQKTGIAKCVGGMNAVEIEKYLLFALPGNSLVMCWRNELLENPEQEGQYYNDLYFGGPVPKLPAEVYALRTEIDGTEYLWQGKHLTTTQKNGKFYEWALYSPNQAPPVKPKHVYAYTLVYRINNGDKGNVSLASSPDITIDNQDDFEKLIIEGMRELSDDPDMPAPFTLEEVLSLTL